MTDLPPESREGKPIPAPQGRRRNPWIWVSAGLAVVVLGIAVWALTVKSESDDANDELKRTQQQLAGAHEELEAAQQTPTATATPEAQGDSQDGGGLLAAGALAAGTAVIKDLQAELGATQEDLEATEQKVEESTKQAEAADEKAAAAAKQADKANDATARAEAEADQAKAEVDAAESRAAIVRECTRAYLTAIGQLFEGDDPEAQAAEVRDRLEGVTVQCKSAFADA
jgi:Skp family chaperone for outer membrane proteins